MAKLVAKTALGVGALPGKLVGYFANTVAQTCDALTTETARREAAMAFAANEPLPYEKLKRQYKEARMASIRYRVLHNPLMSYPAEKGVDQGNGLYYSVRIILLLIFVYYLSKWYFATLGPRTLLSDVKRDQKITLPFDREELERIHHARGGGHH